MMAMSVRNLDLRLMGWSVRAPWLGQVADGLVVAQPPVDRIRVLVEGVGEGIQLHAATSVRVSI